jgi:hypothetical protein
MALTARQRNTLPNSAFAIPSRRAYPMPTKAQAKRAGISEAQRVRLHRNALARSTNTRTAGNYQRIATIARRRAGNQIATVNRRTGTTTRPGLRRR